MAMVSVGNHHRLQRQRVSSRLRAIEGSAVLTMVVSSVCMKKPAATIHNIGMRGILGHCPSR